MNDFEKTLQFASDDDKCEIKPVIVDRDYTRGHFTAFASALPDDVKTFHPNISEAQWTETVETVNGLLKEAEQFDWHTVWTNLAICLSCYSALLCLPNRYEQCLDKAWEYLQRRNETLFVPNDLYWQDPRLNGLVQLSVVFPEGTMLGPGERLVVDILKESGNRLSKQKDHVYYGVKLNNLTLLLDDNKIYSTVNLFAYGRWVNSAGDSTMTVQFPTRGFRERYPLVGPFVMDQIQLRPSTHPDDCQFVRFRAIRGNHGAGYREPAQLAAQSRRPYELRFREQRKPLVENEAGATIWGVPPAVKFPNYIDIPYLGAFWAVQCDPDRFAALHGLDKNMVFGPWEGAINMTNTRISLWGSDGKTIGLYEAEKVGWRNEPPWPVMDDGPAAADQPFVMRRLSLTSHAHEPRNWVAGASGNFSCDPTTEGGSMCPQIDACTLSVCDPVAGGPPDQGVCRFSSLVCNHPNFDWCYPDANCLVDDEPSPDGCRIRGAIQGHGISDLLPWGHYQNPEMTYWRAGCTVEKIDCVYGDWSAWSACPACQPGQRSRTRSVLMQAADGGLPCRDEMLRQTEPCPPVTCPTAAPPSMVPTAAPNGGGGGGGGNGLAGGPPTAQGNGVQVMGGPGGGVVAAPASSTMAVAVPLAAVSVVCVVLLCGAGVVLSRKRQLGRRRSRPRSATGGSSSHASNAITMTTGQFQENDAVSSRSRATSRGAAGDQLLPADRRSSWRHSRRTERRSAHRSPPPPPPTFPPAANNWSPMAAAAPAAAPVPLPPPRPAAVPHQLSRTTTMAASTTSSSPSSIASQFVADASNPGFFCECGNAYVSFADLQTHKTLRGH